MSKMHMPLKVELEDGTTFEVVADQRDAAEWEVQPFGTSFFAGRSRPLTLMRWMAWAILLNFRMAVLSRR